LRDGAQGAWGIGSNRNIGIMEEWNNGENKFPVPNIPTFPKYFVAYSEFWLLQVGCEIRETLMILELEKLP